MNEYQFWLKVLECAGWVIIILVFFGHESFRLVFDRWCLHREQIASIKAGIPITINQQIIQECNCQEDDD